MSAFFGFLLADGDLSSYVFLNLILGGILITGSSNGFNQIIEYKTDKLMSRTSNRPLPTKVLSITEALSFCIITGFLGLYLLASINSSSFILGLLAMIIYTVIYTPLKKITPFAVFIGAIPGSIPPLLGYVAEKENFGLEAGILFVVQFFWQFPHFWAIGWFLFDDYKKGGFFMLPTGKRDRTTAVQVIFYSVCTVLSSLIPAFGVTGDFYITPVSAIIIGGLGIWFVYFGLKLYKQRTDASAKALMLVSVSYITLLQIIYVADKFIR